MIGTLTNMYLGFGVSFVVSIAFYALNLKFNLVRMKSNSPNLNTKIKALEEIISNAYMLTFDGADMISNKGAVSEEIKKRFNDSFLKISSYYNYDFEKLRISEDLTSRIKQVLDMAIQAHNEITNYKDNIAGNEQLTKIQNACWALTDKLKQESILFKR